MDRILSKETGFLVAVMLVALSRGAPAASLPCPVLGKSQSPEEAWKSCECEVGPGNPQELEDLLGNITDTARELSKYVKDVLEQYLEERFQNSNMGQHLDWSLPNLPVMNQTHSDEHNETLTKLQEDIAATFQNLLYFQVYVEQAAHDEGLQTQVINDYTSQYSHVKTEGLCRLLRPLQQAADKLDLDVEDQLSQKDPMGKALRDMSNAMHRHYRDFKLLIDLSRYLDHIVRTFSSPVTQGLCQGCEQRSTPQH